MGTILRLLMGFIGGSLNVGLTIAVSLVRTLASEALSLAKGVMSATMAYHQEGIAFGRELGMSLKQSQAYTSVLIDRASELGMKYGIAADKVFELQRNLSEATGRAVMLGNADAERLVQINKLVGSDVTRDFSSTIMNNLGGQLHAVEGALSKAYATAARSGLDAARMSKKVADNLSLANRYSFRDGLDGITRMTAMSEKLGVNMSAIANSMDNFMDLPTSIEHSAQLNMLGGAAAAFGSNPLTMSYEANYDPEALMKRLTDTLGGLASFDKDKGIATVNGMNRDFVASIAKAIGMSLDDAMTIAKKQAEVKYKESAFTSQLSLYSKEQQDFIINKSYIGSDGKLKMSDNNGNERNVGDMSRAEITRMQAFNGMSDSDVIKSQALSLTSIQEKIDGIKTTLTADGAREMQKAVPAIMRLTNDIGLSARRALEGFWPRVANGVVNILSLLERNFGKVDKVFNFLGNAVSSILDNGKLILGAILGIGAFNILRGLVKAFSNGFRLFSGGLSMGAKGIGSLFKGIANGIKGIGRLIGNAAKSSWGFVKSLGKGAFGGLKTVGKFVGKNSGIIGAAIGVAEGAYSVWDYSNKKKNLDNEYRNGSLSNSEYSAKLTKLKEDRNSGIGSGAGGAIGAAIGTALAGPIGTVVGGILGSLGGKFIGKHWDSIASTMSSSWDAFKGNVSRNTSAFIDGVRRTINGIAAFGTRSINSITSGVNRIVNGIGKFFVGVGRSISNTFSSLFKAVTSPFEVANSVRRNGFKSTVGSIFGGRFSSGGVVGGSSFTGDNVRARVNSGEMVLNSVQQKNLFEILDSKYSSNTWNHSTFGGRFSSGGVVGGSSFTSDNVRARVNSGEMVKTKPVGEKEFIFIPTNLNSNGNVSKDIKINDFNVNISGSIRLDGGSNSKDIDINKLLSNSEFVSTLKNMIKNSINNDINCGKIMNDDALRRGMPAQTSLWGRK